MIFGEYLDIEKCPLQLSESVLVSHHTLVFYRGHQHSLGIKPKRIWHIYIFLMMLDDIFVCICGSEMYFSSTAVGLQWRVSCASPFPPICCGSAGYWVYSSSDDIIDPKARHLSRNGPIVFYIITDFLPRTKKNFFSRFVINRFDFQVVNVLCGLMSF